MAEVARHAMPAGQPPGQGQPLWLPGRAPLAWAGCSPMLLPAVSAQSKGGEQGEGFTARKSRCC